MMNNAAEAVKDMGETIINGAKSMMGGASSGGENLGTQPDKGS